jgi:Cdc6-like AAA superfamily ATPase
LRNLFTLPSTFPNTTVRVIAISNSLDLTARRSISSVLAELSPDNLSFSAYGSKDMIDILRSRIISVKTEAEKNGHDVVELDDKAIELVGRKVEASNGDLRMCLNIMVEAISTTEAEWKKKSSSATTPRSNAATLAPCKVTLTHVLKALTSSIAKLKANVPSGSGSTASGGGGGALETKVRSLNVQVKSILLALLVARQRQRLGLRPAHISAQSASYLPTSGSQSNVVYSDRITIDTLLPTYTSILNHASSSIPPVGQTDFMDLVMQAEVIGIITMDENHHHHHHHHSSVSSSSSFMSVTNVSTTSSSSSSSSSSYPNTPTKSLSRRKSTKSGSRAGDRPIDLMVKDEDLVRALHLVIPHQSESTCKSSGAGSGSGGMMDIELRNTWMREETRWVRAMEGKARAAGEVRERASGKGGRLGFDEV